ncbi:bifunctional folylpolyglutamate synthase/dihydrofolate synthase [Aquisalibacillus elongatus]|uniref:Dihydrofolate synthase/folylpolyglutamate synthase n=1 Tax=Aquisalibacillus elongatus TaxID=485577 RepID=A0A3N5C090_9BACI|nr:folylpolyglutamate synthase/dihydrofolate synthase family protein [Aquisalibacillus elongatus]RPF55468.1 dihydrofolate synthase/folylpolyglutamate synthase [Aquisalibacillus elongatus]
MNEQEAIQWIHDQIKFGIKPGLERVEWLLDRLNNPQKELKLIHVAGTNGKGSTVTFLRNIMQEHHFTVGTFTSPYIEVFNERISINGAPIDSDKLVHYVSVIKPLCEELADTTHLGRATEFEIITVIALKYFQDENVDYTIMEVGLGGRLDSTNIINPLLSIITMIGYDHMDILGDTLGKIAYEKAGIIKANTPVITNEIKKEAYEVICQKAISENCSIDHLHEDYEYEWRSSFERGEIFSYQDESLEISSIKLNMVGKHQVENATLSIKSFKKLSEIEGFSISIEKISKGIENSKWVGRFEMVQREPTIIMDGAHNPEALRELIDSLRKRYDDQDVKILMSVVKNKSIKLMVKTLNQYYDDITLTTFDFFKSYSKKELLQKFDIYDIIVSENWKSILDDFIRERDLSKVLVVTGSLYFVSEVREYLIRYD